MYKKTIIIDKNSSSLNNLTLYVSNQMPQLNLIGSFKTVGEGIEWMEKEQAQLIFVNIEHLEADTFLQLQQMREKACSIIFLTPKLIEEKLSSLPIQLTNAKQKPSNSIQLKLDNSIRPIDLDHIIRLQAQSNYTQIYVKDRSKPILVSKTLKSYVEQLDNNHFIRAHQSHLINRDYIDHILTSREKYVVLKDGSRIKVSRRRVRELKVLYPC